MPAWAAQEVTLRVAGWNMESGESDDGLLRQQLGEKDGIHVWGLSEVRNADALRAFELGTETGEDVDFSSILGTTGGQDRLAILYSTARFDLVSTEELSGHPAWDGHRAPLVAHLRGKLTGQEVLFMVNHLARRAADKRLQQAAFLNSWVREQSLPVVAVGDYNLDYHVSFGSSQNQRDPAYDVLIDDDAFIWLKPERLVKTQASDSFASVLDFVFVANPPEGWTGTSRILEREGDAAAASMDFADDADATDHRPVDAVFTFVLNPEPKDELDEAEGEAALADDQAIIARIEQIERELRELRALLAR